MTSYQDRSAAWMGLAFSADPTDAAERRDRTAEEDCEGYQAAGGTLEDWIAIGRYTFGRPAGALPKEIGQKVFTLACWAAYHGIDMMAEAERELARCSTPEFIDKLARKRATRHGRGPLPGFSGPETSDPGVAPALSPTPDGVIKERGARPVPPMAGGIYTASKTRHADRWKALRADGWPIASTWIDEAGKGETACFTDLWRRCIWEASQADALLLYCEPGDILKGALVEVGAALGCGVPVYAVGCEQFTFAKAAGWVDCASIEEALEKIKKQLTTPLTITIQPGDASAFVKSVADGIPGVRRAIGAQATAAAEEASVSIVEWMTCEGLMRHRTPEDDGLKIEGLIRAAFGEEGRRPDGPGLSPSVGLASDPAGSAASIPGADDVLNARLKAAGMYTIPEMMGVTPLSRWMVQVEMDNLDFFQAWLERRIREFLRMKAGYELGDKDKGDELYEWVLAHSAALSEVRDNFLAARARDEQPKAENPKGLSPQGASPVRAAEAPTSPPATPSSQDSGVGENDFAALVQIDVGAMAIGDQAASKISEERAGYQDGFHQGAISAAGRIRSLIRVLIPDFDSRAADLSAPRPSQRAS